MENKQQEVKIVSSGQYIKYISFENLQAPQVYTEKNFAPEIKVDIDISVNGLQKDFYEIVLDINATALFKEKKYFILNLQYAGIFSIQNSVKKEELDEILYVFCPSLLFPFARQIVASTTQNASYPPLLLDPINFKALFEKKKEQTRC
jgi:preprotein translocase subunit SecB